MQNRHFPSSSSFYSCPLQGSTHLNYIISFSNVEECLVVCLIKNEYTLYTVLHNYIPYICHFHWDQYIYHAPLYLLYIYDVLFLPKHWAGWDWDSDSAWSCFASPPLCRLLVTQCLGWAQLAFQDAEGFKHMHIVQHMNKHTPTQHTWMKCEVWCMKADRDRKVLRSAIIRELWLAEPVAE